MEITNYENELDHLESHGYVTREVYELDKRKYCLYPTQKAYDILDEIRRLKKEWDDIITEDLNEEEVEGSVEDFLQDQHKKPCEHVYVDKLFSGKKCWTCEKCGLTV